MTQNSSSVDMARRAVDITSKNISNTKTNFFQPHAFTISNVVTGGGRYSTPTIKESVNLNAEGAAEQSDNNLAVIVSNSYAVPVMDKKSGKIYMAQAGAEFTLDQTNHIVLKANPDFILAGQAKADFNSTAPSLDQLKKVDISLYRISDPEQTRSVSLKGTTISSAKKDLLKGTGIQTKIAGNGSKNLDNLGELMIPESTASFSLQEGTKISFKSSFDAKMNDFVYGGVTKTVMINGETPLFGAINETDVFKKNLADQDIADGNGIIVTVGGDRCEYNYKKDSPDISQRQFNSLQSLFSALNSNAALNVRLEGGVMYIAAKNPDLSVTFENKSANRADGTGGAEFATQLGLYNIAAPLAGVNRFNSLQNLAQKIADIESLDADLTKLNTSKDDDGIVKFRGGEDISRIVGNLNVRVASALAGLSVSGDDLNLDGGATTVWQKTKQMTVDLSQEATRGILKVYCPNHGLSKGATIQVDGFAVDGGTALAPTNAAGAVLNNGGYKQVLEVGKGFFTIALDESVRFDQLAAVGETKVVNAFNKATADPFKFRLVPACNYEGKELIPNDANSSLQITSIATDGTGRIRAIIDGHGLAVGDKILVKNLDAVIKAGGNTNAGGGGNAHACNAVNTHLNDYVATVTASAGANEFTFSLQANVINKFAFVAGAIVNGDYFNRGDLLKIQKLSTTGDADPAHNNFNVAETVVSGGAAAKGRIRFYEANSISKYAVGDTIRISMANAVTVDNLVVSPNTDYKILNVASGVNGQYIEIETNTANAGVGVGGGFWDTSGVVGELSADFKIQHTSSVLDYFGFDRSKLNYDEAYNPDTMNIAKAREMNAVGNNNDPRVRNIVDKSMSEIIKNFVTSNGEERKVSVNYMPITANSVAIEIAIVRDKYGKYGASGVDEAGDGILMKGTLKFSKDGSVSQIDSQLQKPINVSWMSNGEVGSTNDSVQFDFSEMRFLANESGFNATADGIVPSSITGPRDITFGSNGSVNLTYQSGKISTPFKMVLAYANDMSKLRPIGYGLYEITSESGEMKFIYAGTTDLTTLTGSMTRNSAADMVKNQLTLSEFLSLTYAQAAVLKKRESSENEVIRTIAAA